MGWWRRPERDRGPARPPEAREPGWSTLPALQLVVPDIPLTAADAPFRAGLQSWRDPSFLEPLRHAVHPAAPSGSVEGLVAPRQVETPPVPAPPDGGPSVLQRLASRLAPPTSGPPAVASATGGAVSVAGPAAADDSWSAPNQLVAGWPAGDPSVTHRAASGHQTGGAVLPPPAHPEAGDGPAATELMADDRSAPVYPGAGDGPAATESVTDDRSAPGQSAAPDDLWSVQEQPGAFSDAWSGHEGAGALDGATPGTGDPTDAGSGPPVAEAPGSEPVLAQRQVVNGTTRPLLTAPKLVPPARPLEPLPAVVQRAVPGRAADLPPLVARAPDGSADAGSEIAQDTTDRPPVAAEPIGPADPDSPTGTAGFVADPSTGVADVIGALPLTPGAHWTVQRDPVAAGDAPAPPDLGVPPRSGAQRRRSRGRLGPPLTGPLPAAVQRSDASRSPGPAAHVEPGGGPPPTAVGASANRGPVPGALSHPETPGLDGGVPVAGTPAELRHPDPPGLDGGVPAAGTLAELRHPHPPGLDGGLAAAGPATDLPAASLLGESAPIPALQRDAATSAEVVAASDPDTVPAARGGGRSPGGLPRSFDAAGPDAVAPAWGDGPSPGRLPLDEAAGRAHAPAVPILGAVQGPSAPAPVAQRSAEGSAGVPLPDAPTLGGWPVDAGTGPGSPPDAGPAPARGRSAGVPPVQRHAGAGGDPSDLAAGPEPTGEAVAYGRAAPGELAAGPVTRTAPLLGDDSRSAPALLAPPDLPPPAGGPAAVPVQRLLPDLPAVVRSPPAATRAAASLPAAPGHRPGAAGELSAGAGDAPSVQRQVRRAAMSLPDLGDPHPAGPVDGTVPFTTSGPPDPPPYPPPGGGAPPVQRAVEADAGPPPAPAPTAPPGTPAAAGPAPGGLDLDDLVRRLYDPLSARIKAELRLDRERSGLLTDLRH